MKARGRAPRAHQGGAAQTPITRDDPLARVKAIEKAIERIKSQYPQFFHIPKEQ